MASSTINTTPNPTTFNGFTFISSSISFHKAPPSQDTPPHPSLLVLCSWMAASPKHIQKYTDQYIHQFPQTSILLLQCSLPAIFYSSSKHQTLLSPARDIIRSFEAGGNIVLHAFSNGGSTIACHLASQLTSDGNWAGFDRVILDCCPSFPTISGAVDAISFSLPQNPLLHFLGRCILRAVVFSYLLLFVRLAGREDGVSWIRRVLNAEHVFTNKSERLYVFSTEDALVQDWAVEIHAREAEEKGYVVRRERFEKGAHCALGVADAGGRRYWGAVRRFLEPWDVISGERD